MDKGNLTHNMGCDPEVFIYSGLANTKYGPLPDIIPPAALVADYGIEYKMVDDKKVFIKASDYQWSEDGAAIELQMKPTDDTGIFARRIQASLQGLSSWLGEIAPKTGTFASISKQPLAYFDVDKYWKGRGEEFQDCVRFGCDPDQFPEMYINMGLDIPSKGEIDVSKHSFRYGGGHLHIQATETNPKVYFPIWEYAAVVFDFIVGITNSSVPRTPEFKKQELARLEYYGKPGRIRLQAYNPKKGLFGLEYRVMSNYWVSTVNSDRWYGADSFRDRLDLLNKLLHAADLAASICETDGLAEEFVKEHEALIPAVYDSIMTLNTKRASSLLGDTLSWAHAKDMLSLEMFSFLSCDIP